MDHPTIQWPIWKRGAASLNKKIPALFSMNVNDIYHLEKEKDDNKNIFPCVESIVSGRTRKFEKGPKSGFSTISRSQWLNSVTKSWRVFLTGAPRRQIFLILVIWCLCISAGPAERVWKVRKISHHFFVSWYDFSYFIIICWCDKSQNSLAWRFPRKW